MKKRQFDAERVINELGGKCQTREGSTVTQLHLFSCCDAEFYPLAGVVDGMLNFWTADGRNLRSGSYHDLIMPRHVVAEWWQNAYSGGEIGVVRATLESAKRAAEEESPDITVTTVHITVYSDNTAEAEVVE